MKNQRKTITTIFIILCFSLVTWNTAVATSNSFHNTFTLVDSTNNFQHKIRKQFKLDRDTDQNDEQVDQLRQNPSDNPTVSNNYFTKSMGLISNIYNSIRQQAMKIININELDADPGNISNQQELYDNIIDTPDDQLDNLNETQDGNLEVVENHMDTKWMMPFSKNWKMFGGIDYAQKTFQQKGRIDGSSNSSEAFASSLGKEAQFETTYHLLSPRIGLEKHMNSKAKITAVMEIPAYAWTEHQTDDPEIELFNPSTGETTAPTKTGLHTELAFNQNMSDTMFLQLALSYSIIQSGNTGQYPKHNSSASSLEGEQIGAVLKMGAAL